MLTQSEIKRFVEMFALQKKFCSKFATFFRIKLEFWEFDLLKLKPFVSCLFPNICAPLLLNLANKLPKQ